MRTAKGIKCTFNSKPALCHRNNEGIINPAGIMIAKPTLKPTTAPGRKVFRPPGHNAQTQQTKVVQKPQNSPRIGGFGTQENKRLGTKFSNAANKAEVDQDLQQQLLALQQQIISLQPQQQPKPIQSVAFDNPNQLSIQETI